MRGAGTSTLAVIASMACRRRVIDIDDLFEEATGFSTARYRNQFGTANHNLRQEELLRTTLHVHGKDTIIVCNGSSLERNGRALMQEFAKSHPVVHVLRELSSTHEYLEGIELDRLKNMLDYAAPILRCCSNYEFYNITETKAVYTTASDDSPAPPAFLTLKRAQRSFLKFLSLITTEGNSSVSPESAIPPLEPGYPLSDVATELRRYTCAVQVPYVDLLAETADIQALELGSDAFEIVINLSEPEARLKVCKDGLADDLGRCISKVRRSTVVPIVYHVLAPVERIDCQPLYLELVHLGLRLAPEYATINLALGEAALVDLFASRGTTKFIGHVHSQQEWEDPFWIDQYEVAVRLNCALVRFTRPASPTDDEYSLQQLRFKIRARNSPIPMAIFNTGKAGRRSACFNHHLTPVLPASVTDSSLSLRRGQLNLQTPWITAREVTQALYASFVLDPMRIYIIGASLGYSVSPAMHNAAYESCGMPHRFNRVQSSSLNSLRALVHETNFGGSIVIQPYKVEVMSLTDALSSHARAIGAVNTLIPVRHLKNDGSTPSELDLFQERNQSGPVLALYGDNTEWIGIRSCVRRGLSPANSVRPSSCGLVIGAGGMARAAVYALLQLGVGNIALFNRTHEKAEQLVTHFTRLVASKDTTLPPSRVQRSPRFHVLRSRAEAWPQGMPQPTIVLSCIPADPIDGGPAAQSTLPPQWLHSPTGGVVMEIAYKTLNTPLMQQVRKAGQFWIYMDGLDFLPEQAFAQFELFTGKRAPRRVMREEVLRAWRDEQGNADPDMVQRRLKAMYDQDP
jgi:shikimate 5-dehydrogenase/shikimate kinase